VFSFSPNSERIAGYARELLHTQHINEEDYVNIYSYYGSYHILEKDGFFIHAERIFWESEFNPAEEYNGVTFVSLKDAPWETYTTGNALNILRHTAGLRGLAPFVLMRFDVNGDGVVDAADALEILRLIANS
jgi:hypothetical protein